MSWNEICSRGEEPPGAPVAHLRTQEGQAPIVLLKIQVLFFNHRAAPTTSVAIMQICMFCCQSSWPEQLLNMQGVSFLYSSIDNDITDTMGAGFSTLYKYIYIDITLLP